MDMNQTSYKLNVTLITQGKHSLEEAVTIAVPHLSLIRIARATPALSVFPLFWGLISPNVVLKITSMSFVGKGILDALLIIVASIVILLEF